MLSYILLEAYSNEVSSTGLEHIAVRERRVLGGLFSVDSNSALLDLPARISTAFRESHLDQRGEQRIRLGDNAFRHLFWS